MDNRLPKLEPPPDWLAEMRRHWQQTGSYRPQDVQRVLGDPRKGVLIGGSAPSQKLIQAAPVLRD